MSGRGALRSPRPAAHFLRGFLWIVATVLFFTSFIHLDLAEATALIFVAPLFITAISAVFLREQVGRRRWLAVLVGFIGVLIVIRPGTAAFQPAALLPVLTAFVYALLMLSARWVDQRESVWTMLLYLTGASAFLSAFIVPFVWQQVRLEEPVALRCNRAVRNGRHDNDDTGIPPGSGRYCRASGLFGPGLGNNFWLADLE